MGRGSLRAVLALPMLAFLPSPGVAANKATIAVVSAYNGETGVRVDVHGHNEVGLLEYFHLIVFDAGRLEFEGIAADRGALWYGLYPTHVSGDSIYVHGWSGGFSVCLDPDTGEPGSPLYHLTFRVEGGAAPGLAGVAFGSQGIWDGHWLDCAGSQISPDPEYFDGGVNVLGHAGHVTVGSDSAGAGQPVVLDVRLHNDLDVFEYFHRLLFDSGIAEVDSVVAARGVLHGAGPYPTHVSGDTMFVHGWAGTGGCFPEDPSYPGDPLYRIHLRLRTTAPGGAVMPVTFAGGDPVWNHWVGCDLTTTDSFTATDGSVFVLTPAAVEVPVPPEGLHLGLAAPNPTEGGARIRFHLPRPGPVEVAIYDVQGRRIRTLAARRRPAGWHEVSWDGARDDGSAAAPGAYFFRIRTDSGTLARKLVKLP